ncbi:MAG: hypothetical protein WBG50_24325 [Desulfomonilaceae bacterium]
MKIWCESLDYQFDLPERPERITSSVAAPTLGLALSLAQQRPPHIASGFLT